MLWKTSLTKIDNGREIVRGHDLENLVKENDFVGTIFLLLRGKLPTENEKRMVNALFTAAIDHGVGAPSATVARTVASTGNSLHTAVAAGVLALGDLHGGAIEGAAKFFQEQIKTENVAVLVADLKERKIRLPGFGHKVLAHDHRADVLFEVAKETAFFGEHCILALKVEEALNKISSKKLPLNIDGAMGAIISDMGFDWRMAKGLFIIARIPGLVAQVYEEITTGDGVKRIEEKDIEIV